MPQFIIFMAQNLSMKFSEKRNTYRWIIIIASFIIVAAILWNTYIFFQIFKNEERIKMEIWAQAQKTLINAGENTELELPFKIISNNSSIPIILTDQKNQILSMSNIDSEIQKDKEKSKAFLLNIKKENEPIVIEYVPGKFQYLYYGNSSLINKLKFYPIALLLILVLFGTVVYNFYRSTKMATQNKLWAGMAKETAHQIGTPLSSLIGWIEIMRTENIDQSIVAEIENDVNRLQTITDRFSKIGSRPVLARHDIIHETRESYNYLKSRYSKQVEFFFSAPDEPIIIAINPTLHSWTIENLVKNAIDAMRGKGILSVTIETTGKFVFIRVSDTGKGIPKTQFSKIFEPGFSTKQRGWGLGLSLTKRIVEEYHKGRIKVLNSEVNKGTTIQISFKTE